MTHKLRPSQINLEDGHGESYFAKLLRKERLNTPNTKSRPASSHKKREKTSSNVSQSTLVAPPSANQVSKVKSVMRQENDLLKKFLPVAHKESCSDNSALVEVTVKTRKKQKSRNTDTQQHKSRSSSASRHEAWDKIFKNNHNSHEKSSLFSSFDPLRTIHFLAKELKYKMETLAPEDHNIIQMINDMQLAVKRVPPEVASAIHLKRSAHGRPDSAYSMLDEKPEKLMQVIKTMATSDKLCQTQTSVNPQETKKIQQIMEESTTKLEATCRQMEMLCGRLRSDNEDLEKQLKNEKENVMFLKKRVGTLEEENEHLINHTIYDLQNEKGTLEAEVETLKQELKNNVAQMSADINAAVQDVRLQKDKVENECSNLKHQLTIAQLEKEKYLALLALRDQQISEIKLEMDQLQQVISEQLKELNNSALSNMPSGESLITNPSETWMNGNDDLKTPPTKCGDNVGAFLADEPRLHLLKDPSTSFRELPSGDSGLFNELLDNGFSSANSVNSIQKPTKLPSTATHKTGEEESTTKHTSIRDMFSELKKQAYKVTSSHDQTNLQTRFGSKKSLHS